MLRSIVKQAAHRGKVIIFFVNLLIKGVHTT